MPFGPDGPAGANVKVATTLLLAVSSLLIEPARWLETQTVSGVTRSPSGFLPTTICLSTLLFAGSIRQRMSWSKSVAHTLPAPTATLPNSLALISTSPESVLVARSMVRTWPSGARSQTPSGPASTELQRWASAILALTMPGTTVAGGGAALALGNGLAVAVESEVAAGEHAATSTPASAASIIRRIAIPPGFPERSCNLPQGCAQLACPARASDADGSAVSGPRRADRPGRSAHR